MAPRDAPPDLPALCCGAHRKQLEDRVKERAVHKVVRQGNPSQGTLRMTTLSNP